jgi:protein-ribulosamine 3-kinase
MGRALDLEIKAKGYDPEFDVLVPIMFNKVIPRLLGPLESEGRKIKPSLVHGDLWYESMVFDACCFYGHNECK